MLGRDGRQIDELKVHILVRHHAGLGMLGRERIRRDMRPRPREPRVQRRLARVRRSDQRDLRRTLGADHQRRGAMSHTLSGPLELIGKVFDAGFDIRLEVLGPFVLGDGAQHLPQPPEALTRLTALVQEPVHA